MSFPKITATKQTVVSNSGSHSVDLPSSRKGQLLIIFSSHSWHGGVYPPLPPTGWSTAKTEGGRSGSTHVYMKIAESSDSDSTASFVTGAGCFSMNYAVAVEGVSGGTTASTDYEIRSLGWGGNTVNFGSLTPTWGSADNLWIVHGSRIFGTNGTGTSSSLVSYEPSFDLNQYNFSKQTPQYFGTVFQAKNDTSTSLDPGSATWSNAWTTLAFTLVLKPGTSGLAPTQPTLTEPAKVLYDLRKHVYEGLKTLFAEEIAERKLEVSFGINEMPASNSIRLANNSELRPAQEELSSDSGIYKAQANVMIMIDILSGFDAYDTEKISSGYIDEILYAFAIDKNSSLSLQRVGDCHNVDVDFVSIETDQIGNQMITTTVLNLIWLGGIE